MDFLPVAYPFSQFRLTFRVLVLLQIVRRQIVNENLFAVLSGHLFVQMSFHFSSKLLMAAEATGSKHKFAYFSFRTS